MANPNDMLYVVTAEDCPPVCYNGKRYNVGDTIRVKYTDRACFTKVATPPLPKDCCFPELCQTSEGYTTDGYRVPVIVEAGATDLVLAVPIIEGCKPPNTAVLHYCGGCVYVGYDETPLIDPADEAAALGGGADPNPLQRDIRGIQTLHFANPSADPVRVMVSFYC